jgi:hypothetical protein
MSSLPVPVAASSWTKTLDLGMVRREIYYWAAAPGHSYLKPIYCLIGKHFFTNFVH